MNWLKKIKPFVVLTFVIFFLASASASSCKQAADKEDTSEHPAGDTTKKADHPQGEHPKSESDTTKVEN